MQQEMLEAKESDFYLGGRGVDVSFNHVVKTAIHRYVEPSQLVLLHNEIGFEAFDYLYAKDIINETKYHKILLYEWFLVIKEGGYLVIEFEDNEILDYQGLKDEIDNLQLLKGRQKIVHESSENTRKQLVIKKTQTVKRDDKEIECWTFGIATNGKRTDLLGKLISSIRELNLAQYEIIICGKYNGEISNDIKYIDFSEKDDKGWITKKKNLICENAKFENIAVIHDRVYFAKDWFEGIKKWGNYFDVMSCAFIVEIKNRRYVTNWESVGKDFRLEDDRNLFHSNGRLDASDWDENAIIPGPIILIKKSIWAIEKWNEDFFWGDAEDIEYSLRQHRSGILLRFNPYAKTHASQISGVVLNQHYKKDVKKLGKHKVPIILKPLKIFDLIGLRRNHSKIQWFVRQIKKIQNASSWKDAG